MALASLFSAAASLFAAAPSPSGKPERMALDGLLIFPDKSLNTMAGRMVHSSVSLY